MSRGIINFYFTSKDDMMLQTLKHMMQEQTELWQLALDKAENETAKEKLRRIVRSLFAQKVCSKKRLTVWSAFVAHSATNASYKYVFETETARLRDTMSALAALADPGIDAPAFANGILSYIRGLRIELLIGETARSRFDLEAEALGFLEHLITDDGKKQLATVQTIAELHTVEAETAQTEQEEAAAKRKRQRRAQEELAIDDLFSAA
jgi:TetR/AcrR family transcriptional repressor of bet genes